MDEVQILMRRMSEEFMSRVKVVRFAEIEGCKTKIQMTGAKIVDL